MHQLNNNQSQKFMYNSINDVNHDYRRRRGDDPTHTHDMSMFFIQQKSKNTTDYKLSTILSVGKIVSLGLPVPVVYSLPSPVKDEEPHHCAESLGEKLVSETRKVGVESRSCRTMLAENNKAS
jgi:hypothetical protein